MAAAIAAIWMGRSTVDEMVKPTVDLGEQKAGTEGGTETWTEGKVRSNQNERDPGNIQVPKSLKHPKRGLDQLRVPPGCKGKFLGLESGGGCILIAIPVSPCMNH